MSRHIQSPGIFKTVYSNIFKGIQAYSGILMHIQPHSLVHNQGGVGRPPLLFLKIEKKKKMILEKKITMCPLWVKFCIQNVVSRVSKRKNSKIFPCRTSFSCTLDKMFIKVPQFHRTFIHIETLRHIQAFRHIQHPVEPLHIHNLAMF